MTVQPLNRSIPMAETSPRLPVAIPRLAYRVPEAARMLGVASSTLWSKIAKGEIQARKIGAATVIRHVDLEAYLDATEVVVSKAAR